MSKTNMKVRTALMTSGVYQYELADEIGVSEITLSRWMRKEMPDERQQAMVEMIEQIARRSIRNAD